MKEPFAVEWSIDEAAIEFQVVPGPATTIAFAGLFLIAQSRRR
jgi:hypothetical protein